MVVPETPNLTDLRLRQPQPPALAAKRLAVQVAPVDGTPLHAARLGGGVNLLDSRRVARSTLVAQRACCSIGVPSGRPPQGQALET